MSDWRFYLHDDESLKGGSRHLEDEEYIQNFHITSGGNVRAHTDSSVRIIEESGEIRFHGSVSRDSAWLSRINNIVIIV